MLRNLSKKQKIILISGYCILVLILSITFINFRKKQKTGTTTDEQLQSYITIDKDITSQTTLNGRIKLSNIDSINIPETMDIYKTKGNVVNNIESKLWLDLTRKYDNYEEYENEEWILAKETDINKYTLGSKLFSASTKIDNKFNADQIKAKTSEFLKTKLSIDINNLPLYCTSESKKSYYQFKCSRLVDNYKVVLNLGEINPIIVNLNNDLEIYYIEISHFDLLDLEKTDTVGILAKNSISYITLKQLNEFARISILTLGTGESAQQEEHSHPTNFNGNITSTNINEIQVAYDLQETETGTLLIPIFIMTGNVVTDEKENAYATIIYPATNPNQN